MPDIPQALVDAGWMAETDGKAMTKSFRFKGFREAMAWMARIAFEAEDMDHHPEWTNVYNRVHVRLTSHDAKDLTDRDFELAQRIEAVGGS